MREIGGGRMRRGGMAGKRVNGENGNDRERERGGGWKERRGCEVHAIERVNGSQWWKAGILVDEPIHYYPG